MSVRVDHDTRKREIALKAMVLFSQVGYMNVSLQMIAAAAGISRTVLYRYFKDKREVLDAAIRSNTRLLLEECSKISNNSELQLSRKLKDVCARVVDVLFDKKTFLVAIFDFVLAMVRQGEDMSGKIFEFTKGMRILLHSLVTLGVKKGDVSSKIDPDWAGEVLFGELELCLSRIVLGVEKDSKASKIRLFGIIDQIFKRI